MAYSEALTNRGNAINDRLNENLLVNTETVNNHVGVLINNTGGISTNITSMYILSQSGTVLSCLGKGMPDDCENSNPPLPVVVTPQKSSPTIDTMYTHVAGVDIIKVVTQRGNVFTSYYPPSGSSLAASQLASLFTSGVFGSLFLVFASYTYFSVAPGGTCPPAGGGNSGSCLTNLGQAFQISASFVSSNNIAFSATFTNVDPKQSNITLDKYTSILEYWPVGSSFRTARAYIISNITKTIQSQFTPIVLYYNKPVTIVFGSASPGAFSPISFSGSNAPSSGTIAAVNIVSHGWKAISYAKIIGASPPGGNYGQNSPYVATLYV